MAVVITSDDRTDIAALDHHSATLVLRDGVSGL
jgi:hypothetical protein